MLTTVFSLEQKLRDEPSLIELTQKLTLNKDKPQMGLKGNLGLYGSSEWWSNIRSGVIPRKTYEGVIDNIHMSGMHNESKSFTVSLSGGGSYTYTCAANRKKDLTLYKAGAAIKVTAFQEQMKNGSTQEFVLSIEVSNA